MRKLAMVGLVGAAMAAGSAVVSHAEDLVVANLMIESASDSDAGYATNAARSMAIELFAKEATSIPTISAIPTEATLVPAVTPEATALAPVAPAATQDVAAATMIIPTPRPDFEATKSATSDIAPTKRVAQRAEPKVVKVDAKVDKKRITSLPLPVVIGAFR